MPTEILHGSDLRSLVSAGVISRATTDPVIRQSTVELHASDVAWYSLRDPRERRVTIPPGETICICPGEIVSIITEEVLELPRDLTGTIFPRGRLLLVGGWTTATHVDYAFRGHLRIIIANIGPHILSIPPGEEIGRLQLFKASEREASAYAGVNSDLRRANNQSDYLVIDPTSRIDLAAPAHTWWGILRRVEHVNESHAQLLRSVQSARRASLILASIVAAVIVATALWATWHSVGRFFDGNLGAGVGSGILVIALVAVGAAIKNKIGRRIATWLRGGQDAP